MAQLTRLGRCDKLNSFQAKNLLITPTQSLLKSLKITSPFNLGDQEEVEVVLAERASFIEYPEEESTLVATPNKRLKIVTMIIGVSVLLTLGLGFGSFVSSKRHHRDGSVSVLKAAQVIATPTSTTSGPSHVFSEETEDFEKSKGTKRAKSKNTRTSQAQVDPVANRLSYEVLGPSNSYDPGFMNVWWRMMRQLWTADGGANGINSAMPNSVIDFVPRDNEVPYRAKQLISHWTSPECKFLDLKLKKARTLQDGSTNKVLLMKDEKTDLSYVVKTISNPAAFFNELSFFLFADPKNAFLARPVCHSREKLKRNDGLDRAKIIFNYVEGMDSLEYARTAELSDLKRISAQLFLALEYIHYLKFIHADIKPQNVLINKEGKVQVIDFGFANQLPYGKTSQGTHFTMAPELHHRVPGQVHEGVDWWAYGSTVAMWFGAYYDEQRYRASHAGRSSKRSGHKSTCVLMRWSDDHFESGQVPEEFSESLRSFLYMFFAADPDARLFNTPRLLKNIRSHEFFADVNWSEFPGGDFESIYK